MEDVFAVAKSDARFLTQTSHHADAAIIIVRKVLEHFLIVRESSIQIFDAFFV